MTMFLDNLTIGLFCIYYFLLSLENGGFGRGGGMGGHNNDRLLPVPPSQTIQRYSLCSARPCFGFGEVLPGLPPPILTITPTQSLPARGAAPTQKKSHQVNFHPTSSHIPKTATFIPPVRALFHPLRDPKNAHVYPSLQ